MPLKKTICTLAVLLSVLIPVLRAGAQQIDSLINHQVNEYAQERMYLHFDKQAYAPGETVWFKAYLMEGIYPAEKSKTVYVDWVDDKGAVLAHGVHPAVMASANGHFEIPENYTGGMVHIRAYTKWMLNFDTAFLYQKNIRILQKAAPATASKTVTAPSLRFFPEGGDAVTGISSKIAFKATGQWNLPVAVKGIVVNNKGKLIDSFHSVHDGMGAFYLTPQAGETYTAKWKDEAGKEHTTALPPAKASGVTMQVADASGKKYFVISRTFNAPEEQKQIHVVGTMHQHLVFKADMNLQDATSKQSVIPTADLPTGLLTITVFDNNWNALAERLVFINNGEYRVEPSFSVQRWGLSKRAQNVYQVQVPDGVNANLSVSVTDAGIGRDSSQNILSGLLLTSDLRGVVHNPAYYFRDSTAKVRNHLDLLLLTNGWRRFQWEQVVQRKGPEIRFPRDTTYLTLSGKLFGVPPSLLRSAGSLMLMVRAKDSSSQMLVVPVKSDGTFIDPNVLFFDTLRVHYQLQGQASIQPTVQFMEGRVRPPSAVTFNRNMPFFAPFWDTTGAARNYRLSREMQDAIIAARGKMLEAVTVRAKTKSALQVLDEKYASGLFAGLDGYQFDLTNDVIARSAQSIFTYLQGRVAGLQITANGNNIGMQWRGGVPSVYLDQMPTDVSMLANLPVTDIAYVKVFRPPFMGSFGGGSGAIAVYTKKGSDVKKEPGKGLPSAIAIGYTPPKEFYSPNYLTFDRRNEQRDVRTTLYWNPLLTANAANKVITFSFFNNDVSEAFRVVLEGVTDDGRLIHLEQIVE